MSGHGKDGKAAAVKENVVNGSSRRQRKVSMKDGGGASGSMKTKK